MKIFLNTFQNAYSHACYCFKAELCGTYAMYQQNSTGPSRSLTPPCPLQELKIKRKKKKKQKSRRTLSSNKTVFITKSLVSSGVSTCSYYRIQCSTSPWFLELASHLGVSFHQVLGDIWMGTVNVLSYWQPQVQFITRKLFEKETTSTRDLQENQSERALVLSIF